MFSKVIGRVWLVSTLVSVLVWGSLSAATAQVYPPEVPGKAIPLRVPPASSSSFPAWGWAVIGVAIAVAVTAVAGFGLVTRRRRPTLRARMT